MNTYSIGADSPRWWWPSAAAAVVGTTAIAAILVLPASGSQLPGGTPGEAPAQPPDPWFSTVDPGAGRPCFALPARPNASLGHDPRCGQRPVVEPWSGVGGRRPGLDTRP